VNGHARGRNSSIGLCVRGAIEYHGVHEANDTYFLIAKSPSILMVDLALYTRPYVPLLMKPMN